MEAQRTAAALEFTQLSEEIMKYLAWEVYHIQHLESQQTTGGVVPDSVDLEKRMTETVAEYKKLKAFEDQIILKFKLRAFGVMLSMCTTAGVLLNMGSLNFRSEKNSYYFSGFVIAFSIISALPFLVYPIMMWRQERKIVRIRSKKKDAKREKGQGEIEDGRTTGVSVTELESMPRRTATGLLEEGRARLRSPSRHSI